MATIESPASNPISAAMLSGMTLVIRAGLVDNSLIVIGDWLLVIGNWLLVIDYWLLLVVCYTYFELIDTPLKFRCETNFNEGRISQHQFPPTVEKGVRFVLSWLVAKIGESLLLKNLYLPLLS